MERIESTENKRLKHVIRLRDKAKDRREEGLYIAEGKRWLFDISPGNLKELYVSDEFLKDKGKEKLLKEAETSGNTEIFSVTENIMKKISATETPQGVLAVIRMPVFTFEDMLRKENPLLLFLENIQDPGNLGTIMRTAEGAGVTGVLISKDTTDIYNPKTVRSTMGSLLRVPHIILEDLSDGIKKAKESGIKIYAALPEADKRYDEGAYDLPAGFIIGNEAKGIREETAGLSDFKIRIPMGGELESLNAAMAAGILMYEAARKRGFCGGIGKQ